MKKWVWVLVVLAAMVLLCSTAAANETLMESTTTVWTDGNTYVVSGEVTISDRVTVDGYVTLQLNAGAVLKCQKGITVAEGDTLIIGGSGTLIADASGYAYAAGIGGSHNDSGIVCGTIIINGSTITATGGSYGAGIGGGRYSLSGDITINGGHVTATGGSRGAGIGGGGNDNWAGYYGRISTITINGGTVIATGNSTAADIGGGGGTERESSIKGGTGGTIRINGGQVTATGRGIGPGLYCDSGSITLGWTNESDFIEATSYGCEVSFAEGKQFRTEKGTEPVGTDGIGGQKIVPYIAPAFYDVTVSEGIEHGTVTADPVSAEAEETVTLTVTPDDDYELDSLTVTGPDGGITVTDGQFTMPAGDVTVNAAFRRCSHSISVSVSGGTGGTVSTDTATAKAGTTVTLTVTPEEGYALKSLTVTGTDHGAITVTNGRFTMPDEDVSVCAAFEQHDLMVISASTGYTYENNILTISDTAEYTIRMTEGTESTADSIVIAAGATVTLNNVTISSEGAPLTAAEGSTVRLAGVNKLTAGSDNCYGIATEGSGMTITSAAGDGSTEGSLNVEGGYNMCALGNNITIRGGTITVTAHAKNGAGSGLTVTGGEVRLVGRYRMTALQDGKVNLNFPAGKKAALYTGTGSVNDDPNAPYEGAVTVEGIDTQSVLIKEWIAPVTIITEDAQAHLESISINENAHIIPFYTPEDGNLTETLAGLAPGDFYYFTFDYPMIVTMTGDPEPNNGGIASSANYYRYSVRIHAGGQVTIDTRKDTFYITFKDADGTELAQHVRYPGQEQRLLEMKDRQGLEFAGWECDGEIVTESFPSFDGPATLTATWRQVNWHTITVPDRMRAYNTDNETITWANVGAYVYVEAEDPADPPEGKYTVWMVNGKRIKTQPFMMPDEDVTVTREYIDPIKVTIDVTGDEPAVPDMNVMSFRAWMRSYQLGNSENLGNAQTRYKYDLDKDGTADFSMVVYRDVQNILSGEQLIGFYREAGADQISVNYTLLEGTGAEYYRVLFVPEGQEEPLKIKGLSATEPLTVYMLPADYTGTELRFAGANEGSAYIENYADLQALTGDTVHWSIEQVSEGEQVAVIAAESPEGPQECWLWETSTPSEPKDVRMRLTATCGDYTDSVEFTISYVAVDLAEFEDAVIIPEDGYICVAAEYDFSVYGDMPNAQLANLSEAPRITMGRGGFSGPGSILTSDWSGDEAQFWVAEPGNYTLCVALVYHNIALEQTFRVDVFDQNGVIPAANYTAATGKVLRLPDGLKEIGEEAFMNTAAEIVVIPDGCTKIGARAFAGATNLKEIWMPDSVTEIDDTAFDDECEGVYMICDTMNMDLMWYAWWRCMMPVV